MFSPVNPSQELHALEVLQSSYPTLEVTLSHTVGSVGFLERENASILNASLKPLARFTVKAFQDALTQLSLSAALFLVANDGTLMSVTAALTFPVHTFSSGPVNSMRGAAVLTGLKEVPSTPHNFIDPCLFVGIDSRSSLLRLL